MRRKLSEQDIADIAAGSGILGTGGGGDPYLGTIFATRAVREHGEPELVSVDELPEDAVAVAAAMVGSPVPFMEKLSLGPELGRVFKAMQRALGRPVTAIMSPEIGGVNTVICMALAAELGLPVVDGDGMGRAFPEIELVTYTLHGINVSPFVLGDEHGNVVTIDGADNLWTEQLARTTVIKFGAIAPSLGFPLSKQQIAQAAVLGSVSKALHIGQALSAAGSQEGGALDGILAATDGTLLFKGMVSGVDRQVTGGWAVGEVQIEGADRWSGSSMRVTFQNENLIAFLDGEIAACVPDLICIVEQDTCRGITTERLRYGTRVCVLALPADQQWITPAGIDLAGPRHFGYDFDYRPYAGRPAALAR